MKIAGRMESIPFSGIRKIFEEVTRRKKVGADFVRGSYANFYKNLNVAMERMKKALKKIDP